jgi:hypothetical protein
MDMVENILFLLYFVRGIGKLLYVHAGADYSVYGIMGSWEHYSDRGWKVDKWQGCARMG